MQHWACLSLAAAKKLWSLSATLLGILQCVGLKSSWCQRTLKRNSWSPVMGWALPKLSLECGCSAPWSSFGYSCLPICVSCILHPSSSYLVILSRWSVCVCVYFSGFDLIYLLTECSVGVELPWDWYFALGCLMQRLLLLSHQLLWDQHRTSW